MATLTQKDRRFTYADYLNWPDEERWELIDGEAYNMSPAPNTRHQRVVIRLASTIYNELFNNNSPCEIFTAPIDVVFDEENVLQPDLVLVCDPGMIKERAIEGAPTMVVEVLSPSTAVRDRRDKRAIYERFGVPTYVIVDIDMQLVEIYKLVKGKYGASEVITRDETLHLDHREIEIQLRDVFESGQPPSEPKIPADRVRTQRRRDAKS
jgi:Uma2 family endonuclease